MNYESLTTIECSRIEVISKVCYSTGQISKKLNRNHSTIARKLKRNTQGSYIIEKTHELAQTWRAVYQCKGTKSVDIVETLQEYLALTCSPE